MWLALGTFDSHPVWDTPYWINLAVYVGITIAMGIIMSLCIEVPTLVLRDRLSPSRSGALKSATPPLPMSLGGKPETEPLVKPNIVGG